jgi:hypothetical protein
MQKGISGRGYDGKRWILIDEASQRMLRVGDVVTTFRGEKRAVTGAQPPHKAGSTGKVELDGFLLYPTVVGARWVRL